MCSDSATRPHVCRDSATRLRFDAHWLLSANQSAASELLRCLEGSKLRPEQMMGTAEKLDMAAPYAMAVAVELAVGLAAGQRGAPGLAGDASRNVSIARVRKAATRYANSGHTVAKPVVLLPQGLSREPPQRAGNFSLITVDSLKVIDAINLAESNSYPVSNPSHERPADPLFATWFKTFDALGARELTMAELRGVIVSDTQWSVGAAGLRKASNFAVYFDDQRGVSHPHDLHKFMVGFRGPIGHTGWSKVVGNGGEYGLVARATDSSSGLPSHQWADEASIHQLWGKHAARNSRNNTPSSEEPTSVRRDADVGRLAGFERSRMASFLELEGSSGLFADPGYHAALQPMLEALLSSQRGSPERVAAARAYAQHIEDRQLAYRRVSVSGATAEVQMLQTFGHYLADQKIDTRNPSHTIDVVQVYKLYRRLLDSGQLTTRSTVESWLNEWGLPHQP